MNDYIDPGGPLPIDEQTTVCVSGCTCACVLAVYNKAQAQRILNHEFKLWMFLQGTESRVATFLAETYVV